MSDTTKSPNRVRKPFFGRRGSATKSEPLTSAIPVEQAEPLKNRWYRPSVLKVAAVALALLVMMPTHARGQFGIDVAAILAALSKMQSLMSTYMAAPLKTINQVEQSTAKYEQEVIYPLAAINQAKSSVAQFEGQFSQVRAITYLTHNAFKRRFEKWKPLTHSSKPSSTSRTLTALSSTRSICGSRTA